LFSTTAKKQKKQASENEGKGGDFLNQWIHGSSFLFSAELILWNRGSGRGEEPGGARVLRLIQIRLATPVLKNLAFSSSTIATITYRRFEFHKRRQLFIGVHNETLSVAMRINGSDCAPFATLR